MHVTRWRDCGVEASKDRRLPRVGPPAGQGISIRAELHLLGPLASRLSCLPLPHPRRFHSEHHGLLTAAQLGHQQASV